MISLKFPLVPLPRRAPRRRILSGGATLVFLGLLFTGASGANAAAPEPQAYAWRNVAMRGGGYVTGLAFHPREADLLYARTDVGGAYRWDAQRRMWLPLLDWIGRENHDTDLSGVLSLALDPRDPNRVYLACGEYTGTWAHNGAVMRSDNRGHTWDVIDLPFKLGGNQDGRGMGERLAVDPHDGDTLFLGSTHDGLWRSRNTGHDWYIVSGLPSDRGITFVQFDPTSGTDGHPTPVLYAGVDDPAKPVLYRSTDGGDSWEPVPGQPRGLLIYHAAVDAHGLLYLTYSNALGPNDVTAGAVWTYDPARGTWTDITPVKPDPTGEDKFGYAGLSLDYRHPGTLLVSTLDRWHVGDEIFRSTDGGKTWVPLLAHSQFNPVGAPYVKALKPHWITDVAFDPFHPNRAWFVTGYGVWATEQVNVPVSTRHDLTWFFADMGLEETVALNLISPPEGAPLLSALGDLGGFRHDQLNVSPPAGFFQPHFSSSFSIDFAAQKPALMVLTHWGPTRGALSHDGGRTWTNFASAPPEATNPHGPGIVAISADGARLVWLPKGSAPYYSTDHGETWVKSRADLVSTTEWQNYGPVSDRVDPQWFYLYDPMDGRFYVSTDGGVSFEKTASLPIKGGQLKAEPGAKGHVYVPTTEGLYDSHDGGHSFHRMSEVSEAHQVGFGAPAPGQKRSALFLDGTIRRTTAFYRSDNGGDTWVRISDARLRLGYIRTMTGDARVFGRVYLGTSGRGIMVGEPITTQK